ncbi:uncharacterized protein PAC_07300 [Phialocephala subalpina]|uniref:Carboxymuconolactone decarboxylase-like domain-containing protein n=1 Tax=Phialocephala subalpina TaxID=576137 RepID=A0A1L7WXA8_9HELO|nr:uncharacterized protein PAC_07300 [Phialocephala subalpina]
MFASLNGVLVVLTLLSLTVSYNTSLPFLAVIEYQSTSRIEYCTPPQSPSRTPPIKPSDLTAEQKEANDFLIAWQDDDEALLGPFPVYLAIPAWVKPFVGTLQAIGQVPGVSATARETVILATSSHCKTVYEHERTALNSIGQTKEQIQMIIVGQTPEDLDAGSSVAYNVAKELLTKPGPLKKESWDALVRKFGKQGALAVVHYVGNYAYASILMNAIATPLPEGSSSWSNCGMFCPLSS